MVLEGKCGEIIMIESLVPLGQKTAVKYVFWDYISTHKEYQPLRYVEKELGAEHSLCSTVLMTDEMANFIRTSCRCFYCKKPVPSSLARCECGGQSSGRIIVEFLKEKHWVSFNEILHALVRKVGATRKLANRKSKLVDAGRFTKAQIAQLLVVQDGLCFYCAGSLTSEHGKASYHVDHYVSLLDGGCNEISNLVLACPACNLKKGAEDPKAFIKRRNAEIEVDQKEKAKVIRRKVGICKKKIEANK